MPTHNSVWNPPPSGVGRFNPRSIRRILRSKLLRSSEENGPSTKIGSSPESVISIPAVAAIWHSSSVDNSFLQRLKNNGGPT